MSISDGMQDRWQSYWDEAKADTPWMDWLRHDLYPRRIHLCAELGAFLNQFLQSEISVQEFQATFDQKTRSEWVGFGLKGTSGAMFLNMLVKYLPSESALTQALQDALTLPDSIERACEKMRNFVDFLEDAIASGSVTRRQIQPARSVFFLSAWWHVQEVEKWPVFYISARRVLEVEGLYISQSDLAKDYRSFRAIFQELETALKLESWELEQLCARQNAAQAAVEPEAATQEESLEDGSTKELGSGGTSPSKVESELSGNDGTSHTHVQWMLAKIGRKLGCRVWVARNDRGRIWQGETLGNLSVERLPALGLGGSSQKIIELIDVVWLGAGKQVVAAFEVEHTTAVYSGLLRMSDLGALSPNLNFPLYIVAPEARLDKVRKELSRPTFQILELHRRCGFFSSELLEAKMESILEWATEPSAIDKLAIKVGDIDDLF